MANVEQRRMIVCQVGSGTRESHRAKCDRLGRELPDLTRGRRWVNNREKIALCMDG
jgi:hypothetical protein